MGNVNMEATQIHDRTEAGKHQSVAEHLAALDAVAKKIEDMPTYTSSDRAWLDEWENKLPELPADPVADGVKVLTATTTSGETVKSWETQQHGENQIYSSTPVQIGTVNDNPLYRLYVTFENPIVSADNAYTDTGINSENIDLILRGDGINADGTYYGHLVFDPTYNTHQNVGVKGVATIKHVVIEYTFKNE